MNVRRVIKALSGSDAKFEVITHRMVAGVRGTIFKPGLILALAGLLFGGQLARAQIRDPLKVQEGREKKLQLRGSKTYYSEQWNLDDLPVYSPKQSVSGTIRQWGSNYFADSSLGKRWEEGFKKHQPKIVFKDELKTALAGIPALTFGMADVAALRHITSDETLLYQRYHSGFPLEITVVTGSLNVPGWSYAIGIFVHKDNPISKLTVEQLDGIFGAQRSGAFQGTEWNTAVARGPEKNIRTWGQLGLRGEWAQRPIHVYGYNLRYHIPSTFERLVFQGGAKWNEQLIEFTNYKNADGSTELEAKQVMDAVSKDPAGIGYSSVAFLTPATKALAIAPRGSEKYLALNLQTLRSRDYPLADEVYFYVRKPVDPKVKEFLRYILSREGQDAVQKDGKYLPLPARVVTEQLKKLE